MSEINSSYDKIIEQQLSPKAIEEAIRETNQAGEAAREALKGIERDAIKALTEDGLDQGTRSAPPDATPNQSPGPLDALKAIRCRPKGLPSLGELAKGKIEKGGVKCTFPTNVHRPELEPKK